VTRRTFKRFPSPLQKTVQLYKKFDIETIHAFPIPPWEERLQIIIEKDPQKALQRANDIVKSDSIITATSASVKDGRVGARGAIRDTRAESFLDWDRVITYADRIGT
jgi:hypothetical protein